MINSSEVFVCNKFLYLLLIIFFLSLAISESAKQISIWLIFITFIFKFLQNKQIKILFDLVTLTILFHLLSYILSAFLGVDINESLNKSVNLITMIGIFIVLREINITKKQLKYIFYAIFISFNIATLWGMYNYYFANTDFIKLHSVGSVNRSAVYAMYVFCISSIIFIQFKNKHSLITVIISLFYIVLAGSRMGLFALPIIILIILFLYNKLNIKTFIFITICSFIIAAIILYLFQDSRVAHKILRGFNDIPRIQIWVSSLQIWFSHNIFFGIGIGNSIHFNVETYYGKDAITTFIDNAHNTYLSILLEQGLIGLISYLLFVFIVLKNLFERSDYLSKIGVILIFSSLIMSFMNITFRYEFGLLFMAVLGLVTNYKFLEQYIYNEKNNLTSSK